MKIITIHVDHKTYEKLLDGSRTFDICIDKPALNPGDMLIYNCVDDAGNEIPGKNLPFTIIDKTGFDEFINRIGKKTLSREVQEASDIVIVSIRSMASIM